MIPEPKKWGWCYQCQGWKNIIYRLDPTGWQQFLECDCGQVLTKYSINNFIVEVNSEHSPKEEKKLWLDIRPYLD